MVPNDFSYPLDGTPRSASQALASPDHSPSMPRSFSASLSRRILPLSSEVCHSATPQPISLPTRCGYTNPSTANAAPMGLLFPGCKSGSPTANRIPGSSAVLCNCCTAAPSIQFFCDANRRTSAFADVSPAKEFLPLILKQFPFVAYGYTTTRAR